MRDRLRWGEEEAVCLIAARLRENVAAHHSMLGFNAHPPGARPPSLALPGLTLLVPTTAEPPDGAPRRRVTLHGQPAPAREFAAFGRAYLAVPLDGAAGEHSVEVSDGSTNLPPAAGGASVA
jgi:hypothetical protein